MKEFEKENAVDVSVYMPQSDRSDWVWMDFRKIIKKQKN